ncbi:MAG: hypothetical protein K6A63_03930 [Acholeplasmatales bacterium]|nr:hypothetical protein [Acholeplasmatales bacterium]
MVKVRYYSKLGHTKDIAIAIAEGAGVEAISILDEPELNEYTDILILGGAPYADIMSPILREYAERIDPKMVGKIVLFTTSNWSRRTVKALKKIFKDKNIEVEDNYFYAHMVPHLKLIYLYIHLILVHLI